MNKKKLGKGLAALISSEEIKAMDQKSSKESDKILEIKIDQVIRNPEQPRTHFEKEKLKELADSLKEVGMIEPIIVSKGEQNYQIIAGERRWRAAKIAGFSTIPALVQSEVKDNLLEIMLIENIQREDLTPLEEANSYQLILKQKNITQEKLAKKLGKSRPYVANMIRILKLPEYIKNLINNHQLSVGHAKILLSLDAEKQKKLTKEIVNNHLSVRKLEEIITKENVPRGTKHQNLREETTDVYTKSMEDKIRDILQTKVKIFALSDNKGKIEIEYYSYDDLENIINKIKAPLKNTDN